MAIELTTASDLQRKLIRDSLKALGVSGNNSFTLNGNMLGTGSIFLTAGGNDVGFHAPNGGIFLGYSAGGGWGNSNDGGEIRFYNPGGDDGELRIETRDNGNEAIVFRMRDEVTPVIYEPLVLGTNRKVGVGSVPVGTRSFDNALTIYGSISASGSLYVQSIIENSPAPFSVDVNSSEDAVKIVQRGSGNVLIAQDTSVPGLDVLRINGSGSLVLGASSIETDSLLNSGFCLVRRPGNAGTGIRFVNVSSQGSFFGLFNSIQFYSTRGSSIGESVELSGGDRLFGMRGHIADPTGGLSYRENAEFFAQLSPGKTIGDFKPSDFVFRNNPDNSSQTREVVRIDHAGRVGIGINTDTGTIRPNEALTVVGNISASGTIFAQSINSIGIAGGNVVTSPSTAVGGVSGITDIKVLSQSAYNSLTPKLSSTMYIIL